jgi:tRNA pseudouridine55 synthase
MKARRRRDPREAPGPAGFLVVDKPRGWTSHDVVDAARGWLGTRRVGHLGTLDPLATGVLPLAVREATKLAPFLASGGKGYLGTIRLGEETETLDAEGAVVRQHAGALPDEAAVRRALTRFAGEIEQIPPMYSAVKHRGVPLHRLARQGLHVEREPKRVRIDRLEIVAYAAPDLDIVVECSAGTYVRVLADDLGRALGCGAHLRALRRTRSGSFDAQHAATVEQLASEADSGTLEARLIPPVNALGLPVARLTADEARRVLHGNEVNAPGAAPVPGTRLAALSPGGDLLAVVEARPGRRLQPLRVVAPVSVLAPKG